MKKSPYLVFSIWFLILYPCAKAQPITAISNPVYINFGMPQLELDSEIIVNDPNNNNALDVNERFMVSFFLKNKGKYVANRVEVQTMSSDSDRGMILPEKAELGNIDPGQRLAVSQIIMGGPELMSGVADLKFQIFENNSLDQLVIHKVNTYSLSQKPRLKIIADEFFGTGEGKSIKPGSKFELWIRLKNTGGAVAKHIQFYIQHNQHILLNSNLDDMIISELAPNEVVEKRFRFSLGINYKDPKISIRVKAYDINDDSGKLQELSNAIVDKKGE